MDNTTILSPVSKFVDFRSAIASCEDNEQLSGKSVEYPLYDLDSRYWPLHSNGTDL